MSKIEKQTFQFLKALRRNNNREWFQANKAAYETAQQNMISFADDLLGLMKEHDKIETVSGKKSLHRIFRDVRFSLDKTPYKNNFSGSFRRATKYLRGSYYFHIEPGNTFIGGGFWGPNKEDLKLIRDHIAQDHTPLKKIINSASFKNTFGELQGETLKTAPQGFEKDHPAIELLRYKSFLVVHHFSDDEVISDKFHIKMNDQFKKMRGFLDCMTDMLITDLNGELLPGY